MPSLQKQFDTEQANLQHYTDKESRMTSRYNSAVAYYDQCVADGRSSSTVKKAKKDVTKCKENVFEVRDMKDSCQRRLNEIRQDLARERSIQERTGVPGEIAANIIRLEREDRAYAKRYGY